MGPAVGEGRIIAPEILLWLGGSAASRHTARPFELTITAIERTDLIVEAPLQSRVVSIELIHARRPAPAEGDPSRWRVEIELLVVRLSQGRVRGVIYIERRIKARQQEDMTPHPPNPSARPRQNRSQRRFGA